MNKLVALTAVSLSIAFAPAFAQKPSVDGGTVTKTTPGKGTTANVVRITASVEAIDPATRTVTLKGPRGNVVDVVAGPEVRNFDQIKVGDLLVVRYMEALTLELKKGGAGIRERSEKQDVARAPQGGQPAAGAARQVTVLADVLAVDPKKMIVTLRGPKRTVELKLRDPEQIKLIKVGDQVQATYTEAAAISIEPAPKPAAEKKK
jgi:Cu/Ag efflux protein CusF